MRAMVTSLAVAICWLGVVQAQADPVVESVQRTLKDQGFYYGEVTGTKDADTTAAIRRYQIRNGLQITGELNAETRKSLGVSGSAAVPRATPPARVIPRIPPPTSNPPDTSDLRDNSPAVEEHEDTRGGVLRPVPMPAAEGFFEGTPYEGAPPEVQQRVIMGAQTLLSRRGYYRSGVDGVFGPGTQFALRAYQARFGLEPTGLLDTQTLGSLGLLPGQRAPGMTAAPPRRIYRRPPTMFAPNGERIYVPR